MRMKLAGAALLALGTLTATVGTADAAQGCGPGFHRGWSGWCKPNWRPYAYRPVYYAGRWSTAGTVPGLGAGSAGTAPGAGTIMGAGAGPRGITAGERWGRHARAGPLETGLSSTVAL